MAWDFRKYGTATDPIHKSDLNGITGDYGCDRAFRFKKDALAERIDSEPVAYGKAAAGNATHESIARALDNEDIRARLLSGSWQVSAKQIDAVFREEMDREVGGRELRWGRKDNPEKLVAERIAMVTNLLNSLHHHVAAIVLVEGGFIVELDGYYLSGHVDLLYRHKAAPTRLASADWKSGATKPTDIELDHGWESGIYSAAIERGLFLPRTCVTGDTAGDRRKALDRALIERAVEHAAGNPWEPSHGQFPSHIHQVHLQDLVPYQKAGSKEVKRPEDAAFYQRAMGETVKYVAGDARGPAWLPVRRSEHDVPRLQHQLRNVVGTIRMGRFVERLGEKCTRCAFRSECLTSGYEVRGAERKEVERRLRVLDDVESFDGLGDGL